MILGKYLRPVTKTQPMSKWQYQKCCSAYLRDDDESIYSRGSFSKPKTKMFNCPQTLFVLISSAFHATTGLTFHNKVPFQNIKMGVLVWKANCLQRYVLTYVTMPKLKGQYIIIWYKNKIKLQIAKIQLLQPTYRK